ncbi:MAG TPA: universal stress protein [Acidimicrobiales bacterium]|nr:universal stress protein [Acidimicrobiales bacterium]
MSVILAAIDDSAAAFPVLRAAKAMARTLGADTQAVHIREGISETATASARHAGISIDVINGDPVDRIVELSSDTAVSMVVVGARRQRSGPRPSGHVAFAVMARVAKPVLVVPPDARLPTTDRFDRVLMPLEGTAPSAGAVAAELQALHRAGAGITVLHVFQPGTAPRFWDQTGHAGQSWGTEFLAQWCDERGTELRLRSGEVVAAVLDVATSESIDVIVLGWSQSTSSDRARVVREIIGRSEIPVLLAPTGR